MHNKITKLIAEKGLTQKYIALELGVSCPTVSEWCTGKKQPSKRHMTRLAEMLGVTNDYLLDSSSSNQKPETETRANAVKIIEALPQLTDEQLIELRGYIAGRYGK